VGLRAAPQVLGIWPWTVNFGSAQWLWAGHFPPDYQDREKTQQRTIVPAVD